ncbi:MAG: hypothetical protein KA206_09800 [Paludibacter sp.]|nr:hypothetical protein [Paludibacter sp.]
MALFGANWRYLAASFFLEFVEVGGIFVMQVWLWNSAVPKSLKPVG